jgi:hypothetical protein
LVEQLTLFHISTKGADTTSPPEFSDLATALIFIQFQLGSIVEIQKNSINQLALESKGQLISECLFQKTNTKLDEFLP